MVLFYSRINWENFPSVNTALNAINLNAMDYAVKTLDERTVELDTVKANQSTVLNTIQDWSMDEKTGIITITKVNGEQIMFDLNIEKIPVKFELSEDGILSMTTEDGSAFTANIGSMIPVMTFESTDTISVKVVGEGKDKTYSFEVKDGSITEEKLQPNYLADIKVQAENAILSATASAESATASSKSAKLSESYSHGGTGTRDGEDTDNAKHYAEEAKKTAEYVETLPDGINRTTDRTLEKSKAGGLKINSIEGESQQKQYSGKNLLKNTAVTITKGGVTFTVNEDKSITVKGTATETVYYGAYLSFVPTVGKSYIRSGAYIYGQIFQAYWYGFNGTSNWIGSDGSFTATSDDAIRMNIYIKEGTTIDGTTIYPMIRSADIEDDTYEPYVGGVASPNPVYPQEINSVVLSEIKGVGKNVLNITDTIINEKISYVVDLPAGTYTMLYELTSTDTDSNVGLVEFFASTNLNYSDYMLQRQLPRAKSVITFTVTENIKRIRFWVSNNDANSIGDSGTLKNVMIVKGTYTLDTIGNYELYHEKSIQLSNPITLRGIGDVKDTIVKRDGVYGVLREHTEFDASDKTWTLESINTNNIANFAMYISHVTNRVMCNRLQIQYTIIANTTAEGFFSNGSVIFIRINAERASTVNELKTWLAKNQTIFMCRLATPTFEPLPIADQIALHQLETFDTVTYISTDSTIEPVIEVEYGTSKVGAYAIKGMNDVEVEKLTLPVNNLLATVSGKPLDATQGKVLNDRLITVENNLAEGKVKFQVTEDGTLQYSVYTEDA